MSHPNFILTQYSEKAFVVRYSKALDKILDSEVKLIVEMGGKWNSNLKGGGGWIFPNFKKKIVENYINSGEKKVFHVAT